MQLSEEANKRETVGLFKSKSLMDKIEKYKKLYIEATHELAIEINNNI